MSMGKKVSTAKPSDISKHDLYKDFFKNYLDNKNFIVKDKNTFNELKKLAWGESKLDVKRGSQHDVTNALREILQERGVQIAGTEATSKSAELGNMKINFEKIKDAVGLGEPTSQPIQKIVYVDSSGRPIGQIPVSPPILPSQQPIGGAPTSQTFSTDQQIIKLDPAKKEEYIRLFQRGFQFVTKTYTKLGFIEGDAEPDEPITEKDFKTEIDEYGKDLATYCFEHNINLPQWLELATLAIGGGILLGTPLIHFALHGRKKKENKSTKLKENADKASSFVFRKKNETEKATTTTTSTTEKPKQEKNTIDEKNEEKSGVDIGAIKKIEE